MTSDDDKAYQAARLIVGLVERGHSGAIKPPIFYGAYKCANDQQAMGAGHGYRLPGFEAALLAQCEALPDEVKCSESDPFYREVVAWWDERK